MQHIDTVIIGGGQAGLAMSRCLTDQGVEHVILERGRIAERWRSERWDSLHLLTPNWQSRLPGFSYQGPDPDGFMKRNEVIRFLEHYASSFPAPLHTGVTVTRVEPDPSGYRVTTDQETWTAANVVVATGECQLPAVPSLAQGLSEDIQQVVPTRYKNPGQLPEGGVLVVGASATGIQLAAELHASGRPVTLAVGRHTRLPRTYRGKDILWWFDRMRIFDERIDEVKNPAATRSQPSMQLIGSSDHRTLDLGVLMEAGIRLVGSAATAEGHRMVFQDNLDEVTVAADVKLARLRMRIDEHVEQNGLSDVVEPAERFTPVRPQEAPTRLSLRGEGIKTVLWATGFRRSYPWLRVPVLDARGEIRHNGGITSAPGLYVLGLQFLRRRKSSFIDGVAQDARELTEHLVQRRCCQYRAVA
jgi:putative flavoprotein involved in K+ transport